MKYLLILLIIFSVQGCQTTPKTFKIDKTAFKNRYKTIAIMPIMIPREFSYRYQELLNLTDLTLSKNLKTAGFKVIDSAVVAALYEEVEREMIGNDNNLSPKKSPQIKRESYKRLQEKYQVEAVLYPYIDIKSANFHATSAHWDDVGRRIYQDEAFENAAIIASMFVTQYGKIAALSYCANLFDINANELYLDCGGIELAATMGKVKTKKKPNQPAPVMIDNSHLGFTAEITADEEQPEFEVGFIRTPLNELLTDTQLIEESVAISIRELIRAKKRYR